MSSSISGNIGAIVRMRVGIFGACREGVDCLRIIKGSRLFDNDEYFFVDNDDRLARRSLENCEIFHPREIVDLKLDILVVAVIDVRKVEQQLRSCGYSGEIKYFYGDKYFSEHERYIGMAKIGKYSYYKPSTFLYNVEVGNFCHIGADCRLGLIGHDPKNITTYPLRLKSSSYEFKWEGEPQKRLRPLIVEDDVYIGEGVSIMAGITIGRGSVIGSKSLVTKSIEPYSVVGGIPAKMLGNRLDKNIQDQLKMSGWVNLDIDAAIKALDTIKIS